VEHQAEERIGHAVDQQFVERIVDDGASSNKAGTECRIPALVEKLPIPDDIPAIIRLVGHHNHHGIAVTVINPVDNGSAKAIFAVSYRRSRVALASMAGGR
jgi:hypothetical protein